VQPALFVHLRGPGTWWLNTTLSCTKELQAAYWAVGWLLGQALVNRCTVGLQLAPLLFHRLLLQPHEAFKVTTRNTVNSMPDSSAAASCCLWLSYMHQQAMLLTPQYQ
jgi:hypothetical protein